MVAHFETRHIEPRKDKKRRGYPPPFRKRLSALFISVAITADGGLVTLQEGHLTGRGIMRIVAGTALNRLGTDSAIHFIIGRANFRITRGLGKRVFQPRSGRAGRQGGIVNNADRMFLRKVCAVQTGCANSTGTTEIQICSIQALGAVISERGGLASAERYSSQAQGTVMTAEAGLGIGTRSAYI